MAVLAGLAAVDWVVPFSEDTPAQLIERLLPDVLVKGGDYSVKEIVGGDTVITNGGEVRVLAFKAGRSTTRADRSDTARWPVAAERASATPYSSQPSTCSTSVTARLPAACLSRSTFKM